MNELNRKAMALGKKTAALRVVSGTWSYTHKTTFGARLVLAV